jgi:hypothetical protein
MKAALKSLSMICALVVFFAFFIPWVSIESPVVGGITKVITGKRQAALDTISGFKVPIMANSDESRFMITVIEIFNPGIKDADKKSWLIWGVPLFALALAAAGFVWPDNRALLWAIAGIGVLVFAGGTFKILTTDLNKLVLKARIDIGVWLTLVGYLGIGVSALVRALQVSSGKGR